MLRAVKLPWLRRRKAATKAELSTPPPPAPPPTPAPQRPPLPPPDEGRPARWRTPLAIALGVLAAAAGGLALGYALFSDSDPERAALPAVAPSVVIDELPEPDSADQAGPPAVVTRNTTRIAGVDPTDDAAGVATASFPGGGAARLVVVAPADSWQAALAASSLAADPIRAPILLGEGGEIPGVTAAALAAIDPASLAGAKGTQAVAIAGVATPLGLETIEIEDGDPATIAKLIDRRRSTLSGRPDPAHILVASAKKAAFAMPAAAWAARSGDPIAFADGDEVPTATVELIERHPNATVYVLGPESVISDEAVRRLKQIAGAAIRVGAGNPVANAIEFARFVDGSFGWNIADPGHGFTIANTDRPADAAAAAPLAAGGKPGPLLLTDSSELLPEDLAAFLLDTKPGFTDDPTRAVYNHVWLLGDESAISAQMQAEIDGLTQLEQVQPGSGSDALDGDDGAKGEAEAEAGDL
jgi:hypothetical protein